MPEGNENDDSGVTPTETSENTEGLKRALEAQKRKAQEAEKQLAQLRLQMAEKAKQEDATKSEMDKLVERVKATDERLAKAERRALVSEVGEAEFDDFAVVNPQRLAVTQAPVNGVTKTIPAGSKVDLWRPARYAL